MAVPAGFSIRITRFIAQPPYPIKIHLPPIKGEDRREIPRLCGPELDVVVPADEERHVLLGKFMDAWSLLEETLAFFVSKLVETDNRTTPYIQNSMGTRQLIDMMIGLATLKLAEADAHTMIGLLERVRKLNGKRNALVHGHWLLEVNVYLRHGHAVIDPRFNRELTPLDPIVANKIADPKNQKERVKYIFNAKRIAGATRDTMVLAKDLAEFLQAVRVLDDWKDKPPLSQP